MSAVRGKRGQAFLRDLAAALDAMETKELFPNDFETPDGEYCALGALGKHKGIRTDDLGGEDECEPVGVAFRFDIAPALAAEVMYLNDEGLVPESEMKPVLVCGPMREFRPYWERHLRWVSVSHNNVPVRRWHAMREWVRRKLRGGED